MDPDVAILRALFAQRESYISGPLLAEQLGVSRSAIWKRMEALQVLGFPIQSQPHLGYRLTATVPDLLVADEILARLPAGKIAWQPIIFKETKSTNDLVWREAQGNFPEGLAIVAEQQTQGRGRQGRVWQSTAGHGLYASLLLRPAWPLAQVARLTIVSSLAIAEALEEITRRKIQIKWPNDIFVDGRKLGGILTEVQGDVESLRFAVVGFGLNVHQKAEDFPPQLADIAHSLYQLTGHHFRRVEVLLAILAQVEKRYYDPFNEVREAWMERCLSVGKILQVKTHHGTRQGQAVSLDEDGALLLRVESGQIERITSGDIS
jgi:BirA family transcriptional regulator, biotin operon repressor / biotin---[acetyl-CoA-carboxylase] ligase